MAELPRPRHPLAQPPATEPGRTPPPGPAGGAHTAGTVLSEALRLDPLTATRALSRANQPDGWRCTGCSWTPDGHLCARGARDLGHQATSRRAGVSFFARHPVSSLLGWSDRKLASAGRLTRPMVRHPDSAHYVPIGWEHALQLVSDSVAEVPRERIAVHAGGDLSVETAFLAGLWAREWGVDALTSSLDLGWRGALAQLGGRPRLRAADLEAADGILLFCQDLSQTHPRVLRALAGARERGARIVTVGSWVEAGMQRWIDPTQLDEWGGDGVRITDLYLRLRPGGQAALLHALGRGQGDLDSLPQQCGIEAPRIRRAAQRLAGCQRMVVLVDDAFVHAPHDPLGALLTWLARSGHLDRPGCGVLPLPGEASPWDLIAAGFTGIPEAGFADRVARELGLRPNSTHTALPAALERLSEGDGVFFGLRGDWLTSHPDTDRVAQALKRSALTVHVDSHLRRAHLLTGRRSLLLPCLSPADVDEQPTGPQASLRLDSTGGVHKSYGIVPPPGPYVLSSQVVVACLALATLREDTLVDWFALARDTARVRHHLARIVPGWQDLERRVGAGTVAWRADRPPSAPDPAPEAPAPDEGLRLGLLRAGGEHRSQPLEYGDPTRGLGLGRRVLWLHPDELTAQGLVEGDTVHLVHADGTHAARGFTVLAAPIARDTVLAYAPEALAALPSGAPLEGARVLLRK